MLLVVVIVSTVAVPRPRRTGPPRAGPSTPRRTPTSSAGTPGRATAARTPLGPVTRRARAAQGRTSSQSGCAGTRSRRSRRGCATPSRAHAPAGEPDLHGPPGARSATRAGRPPPRRPPPAGPAATARPAAPPPAQHEHVVAVALAAQPADLAAPHQHPAGVVADQRDGRGRAGQASSARRAVPSAAPTPRRPRERAAGQVGDLDVEPLGAQQPDQHRGEVGVGPVHDDPPRVPLGEHRVEVGPAGPGRQRHGGHPGAARIRADYRGRGRVSSTLRVDALTDRYPPARLRLLPRTGVSHAGDRADRRPVGRRGQGQGHRPARRPGPVGRALPGRQQRRPHRRAARRPELRPAPDPVRHPHARRDERDRQRRGGRPRGAARRAGRAWRRAASTRPAC